MVKCQPKRCVKTAKCQPKSCAAADAKSVKKPTASTRGKAGIVASSTKKLLKQDGKSTLTVMQVSRCIACEGTGRNSKGGECEPCRIRSMQ